MTADIDPLASARRRSSAQQRVHDFPDDGRTRARCGRCGRPLHWSRGRVDSSPPVPGWQLAQHHERPAATHHRGASRTRHRLGRSGEKLLAWSRSPVVQRAVLELALGVRAHVERHDRGVGSAGVWPSENRNGTDLAWESLPSDGERRSRAVLDPTRSTGCSRVHRVGCRRDAKPPSKGMTDTPLYFRVPARFLRPFPDFDFGFIKPVRARAVDSLRLKEGQRVLDPGCGPGGSLPFLRAAVGASGGDLRGARAGLRWTSASAAFGLSRPIRTGLEAGRRPAG